MMWHQPTFSTDNLNQVNEVTCWLKRHRQVPYLDDLSTLDTCLELVSSLASFLPAYTQKMQGNITADKQVNILEAIEE